MCTLNLGATSQLSDFTSCVGDTFTFNCTVDSLLHRWTIGQSEASIVPTTTQNVVSMGFSFGLVEVGSSAIVSSATGTVSAELNNTVILCHEAVPPVQERQEGTVTVFGESILVVNAMHEVNDLGNVTTPAMGTNISDRAMNL